MRIELMEDNGFLNDGVPTLVVLVIDGKHRIPYEATKTIQELYEDVRKMFDKPDFETLLNKSITSFAQDFLEDIVDKKVTGIILDEIQKEDIVKCIKVYPREEGAECDLEVGNEYRVLSISKDKDKAISYDVVNDNSTASFRIKCLPDEIELLRKRKIKTNPVKTDYKEEMMKCSNCNTVNALELQGDKYIGECVKCQARLEMSRPVAKSTE